MSMIKHSQVAKRYAEALFSTINEDMQDQINAEFKQVVQILADPKINDVFYHPRTSKERKGELLKLMKLSINLENFLLLVIEKSRETLLPSIAHFLEQLVLQAQHTSIAEVISAVPLKTETLDELKAKLSDLMGKTIRISTVVDPSIGGGLTIKVDGKIIDNSVSHTLSQFQKSLIS